MEIKVVKNIDEMILLEQTRMLSIEIEDTIIDENNHYVLEMKDGQILPFAVYNDSKIIGGCYITNSRNSLYFDYLFVSQEYRNKGIAKMLCKYILENKEIVENYFKKTLGYSYSEPANKYSEKIFTDLGYRDSGNAFGEWKVKL